MSESRRRYRAFISYSRTDMSVARRIHRALESYRVPRGLDAPVGPDRRLGRFFRDDEEMGADQSLGAALEGALDDSEALIVICSPASARSEWVDREIRRFKRRREPRVFAVIASGQPHSPDPQLECFAPSLKVKVDARGERTSQPDEPRAPDLRQEGLKRVRAQLAAGLLGVSFDELWRRDRRRARRRQTIAAAAAVTVLTGFTVAGTGWFRARAEARIQAAWQAVADARIAQADGRVGEALDRLAPFLDGAGTAAVVEPPVRALLAWAPAPAELVERGRVQAVRFRDATLLVDAADRVYDVSSIGLRLERLIRASDGRRMIAIGNEGSIVLDAQTGDRLAEVENGRVTWLGHSFEAPNGLLVITGAVLGPTNGSVVPNVLTVSADGSSVDVQTIPAPMFWGSTVALSRGCDALLVAQEDGVSATWQVEARALNDDRLGPPVLLESSPAIGDVAAAAFAPSSNAGPAIETRALFMGEAGESPIAGSTCVSPAEDRSFDDAAGASPRSAYLDIGFGLPFERPDRWVAAAAPAPTAPPMMQEAPCTEVNPCRIIAGEGVGEDYWPGRMYALGPEEVRPLPGPRWLRNAELLAMGEADRSVYFEHLLFNSANGVTLCRPIEGSGACFQMFALGEDHRELGFLRSADGRYLYWPFGGTVIDVQTLRPVVEARTIPEPGGPHFDLEADRPGLSLVLGERIVTYAPAGSSDSWERSELARASSRFGVFDSAGDTQTAVTGFASVGNRQYLVVRRDGVVARLDAATSEEVWRFQAVGLGDVFGIELSADRSLVLLAGTKAWRMFRVADGFAISGLLLPPPALQGDADPAACRLDDGIEAAGGITVNCGGSPFHWEPAPYQGEIDSRLAKVVCAADVAKPAAEILAHCLSFR